jgi:lysophospholipase L1-like esterase
MGRVKRAIDIALAALGVLVVVAAVYVVTHNGPSDGGSAGASISTRIPSNIAPSTTAPVSGRSSKTAARTVTGSAPPSGGPEPVVAFLGDEWTAGAGTSGKAHRFTTLLSSSLHVKQRNFGSDGAGYGTSGNSYASHVDELVAAHPDVVVVSGGRNDLSTEHDLTATASEVDQLFHALHTKLPDATLIAVAPFWGDSDLPQPLITLGHEVKDAVTAVHGTYLDVEDPIHGHPGFMANDTDPDDDGHAAIAAALQSVVAPLLPG